MTKPFSPAEAVEAHADYIPTVVVDVVNEFLAQRASSGRRVEITQKEVVSALLAEGLTHEEIRGRNLLDFEDTFRKVGWDVVYDKPGYNETYGAHWIFKPKA